ncbi:MAG: methyltransferase protein [Bacteroidetes bacterium]|nr:methyltransferase protein [Bacteroidota bacterium]
MVGDFESKEESFRKFLAQQNILPLNSKQAIDLGAGHGIHSTALLKSGFVVTAVDFNNALLNELRVNVKNNQVNIINDDIRNVKRFGGNSPELILCMGDTLTHLDSKTDIKNFIGQIAETIVENGKVILSFRDYSPASAGDTKTIPVKSDEARQLTCILKYEEEHVLVTDIFNEKINNDWKRSESSYRKVRISPIEVCNYLEGSGMKIIYREETNGMHTIVAQK